MLDGSVNQDQIDVHRVRLTSDKRYEAADRTLKVLVVIEVRSEVFDGMNGVSLQAHIYSAA